ncbi:MAG TPA: 50S ribosomal protein L11 methyltransferase, partial [Candidatus Limnocylindria bacterium]|nr:50S ribosomal protein L11 methyltransferase [Candidatus Limnocylindria bacterium]
IMDTLEDQAAYVHCAANMRVSAFVFLYRVLRGTTREEAERDLKRIWEPDDVWRKFIDENLSAEGI